MISAAFQSDINLNCVVHLTTSQQGWNIDQKLTAMSVRPHSVSLPVMSESFPFIYHLETCIQDLKWFLGSCLGSCQWYSGPTAPEHGPQRGAVPELLSVRMWRLDRAARHSRNQLAPQRIQYPEGRAGNCAQGSVTSTITMSVMGLCRFLLNSFFLLVLIDYLTGVLEMESKDDREAFKKAKTLYSSCMNESEYTTLKHILWSTYTMQYIDSVIIYHYT